MNPIIFLSIDNVINTQNGLEHWVKVKNETNDRYGNLFCPRAVEALSKVITQFSADVVITCDWRNYLDIKDMRQMLKERNINWNLLDYTPNLNKTRDQEIKKWMDKNGHPSQFVIIANDFEEDEDDILFPNNQVETQMSYGIAEKRLYRKAIAILKRVKHVRQKKQVAKTNPMF